MIEQLPFSERPRERCLSSGPESLSLRECLAVLLGFGPRGKGCMGVAADIMRIADETTAHSEASEERFLTQWLHVGAPLLENIRGLGNSQKAKLLVCFEIARRLNRVTSKQRIVPSSLNLRVLERRALNKVPMNERDARDEWFGFVGVFKTGLMTELRIVARGIGTQVVIDRRKVFLDILLTGAPAFILLHNHPSGDLTPSRDDYELTQTMRTIAKDLDLQCISHLIVTASDAWNIADDLYSFV